MNMENLIELRKDLGLTQEQMAKTIGVKRRTYSDYENGRSTMSLENLNILANKYNKSLDYLTGFSRTNDENFKHINISNDKIRKRLKEIRINYGMSQRELANKLKTSDTIISYYETGKVKITAPVLINYAKFCKKSIDWLCCKK